MTVKVSNDDLDGIPVCQLKDGQLGEIIMWAGNTQYTGRIVQRYRDSLITVGGLWAESWSDVSKDERCRVKVLKNGTHLVVENNE